MKAVIMAGGEGSRLRPLTCDTPKPMARLCAKPIMEYILDLLKKHGCTSAAVTTRYLSSEIKNNYSLGEYKGIELSFIEEDEPLGTAGSVKNAAKDFEEDFLVISGDALCDIDLTKAFDFHKQNRNDVTMIAKRVEDPREFGLISADKYGRITGFLEKPSWRQVYTDTANTGIYILSPQVLSLIPQGCSDFANDIFPKMLEDGRRMMIYESNGYWCDIGDIDAYIRCQRDILAGRVGCEIGDSKNGVFGEKPQGDFTIIPPVYIGRNVAIEDNAVIGPNTVIDDGCHIGRGSKIKRSVVLQCADISERANIGGAVICAGASVGKGAQIFESAVIGSHAAVGGGAQILPNVRVWPHKRVENERRLSDNLQYGTTRKTTFDDTGICGESLREITPELCVRLGSALAAIKSGARIAIGGDFGRASRCFRMALMSGVMASGGCVLDMGDLLLSQFNYASSISSSDMGAYVLANGMTRIILSEEGGLPVCRKAEREIDGRMNRGETLRCSWEDIKYPIDMSGVIPLYEKELISSCENGLFGMSADIKSGDENVRRLLRDVLSSLGCAIDAKSKISIHIANAGTGIAIHSPETGYIWQDKTMLMSLIPYMEKGFDIALPYDAPEAADLLAERYGVSIMRYFSSSGDRRDKKARELAKTQLFVRDGFFQTIAILGYMSEKGISLAEYLNMIPDFRVVRRELPINSDLMILLRSLGGVNTGEGVLVRNSSSGGRVLVRPDRNALHLQLIAEAASMETAQEICGEVSDEINQSRLR